MKDKIVELNDVFCFRAKSGISGEDLHVKTTLLMMVYTKLGLENLCDLIQEQANSKNNTIITTSSGTNEGLEIVLTNPCREIKKQFIWVIERPINKGGSNQMQFVIFATKEGYIYLAEEGMKSGLGCGYCFNWVDDYIFPGSCNIYFTEVANDENLNQALKSYSLDSESFYPADLDGDEYFECDHYTDEYLSFQCKQILHQWLK